MKKTVVIYKSTYGSTKKYAQWLAEELACDLFERTLFKKEQFSHYDTIIYGGGLYASGISGVDLLSKNFDLIKDKKIILFTCGLTDPNNVQIVQGIRDNINKVFNEEKLSQMNIFHLRGAMNYPKLSFVHKSLMNVLCKMLSKKDDSTLRAEDKQMLDAHGKALDFIDKSTIKEILEVAKL